MTTEFKQDNPGCDCCCSLCPTVDDTREWKVCGGDYSNDDGLNSTQNTQNAGYWADIKTALNSVGDRGYQPSGGFSYYGPYSRSGTNYEGYRIASDLCGPGTTLAPSLLNVFISDACNPFGGDITSSITFDDFIFIFGCEWPVGDPCHPRWYWGIVVKVTPGGAAAHTWLCFSEDLGAGPVEADTSGSVLFPPPVLPSPGSTECEDAPSPMTGYMVDSFWVSTIALGFCARNPLPNLELRWKFSGVGLPLPECDL